MDEMTNEAVVTEETTPIEESSAEVSDAEFDALWDEDDGGDYGFVDTDSEEEADQQTEEPAETEEAEPTTSEQPQADSADQDYLELKHFDEVKKVTKEEAKELAQKGMDYDRIRGKLNEANANLEKLQKYEEFLNELKGGFNSIEDLMDNTRARILSDKEGITKEQALARIQSAKQQAAQQTAQQQRQNQVDINAVFETMRRESLTAFKQVYPDVKAKDIPQEVWDDMRTTNNLVSSYAKYEAKKLKEENEVLRKNAENKSRSTGSMKSSGNASYEKSEFDRIMEEDDW